MAEYVILAMLFWCHRLRECEASFRAGSWRLSSRTGGPLHSELAGKTVGVLGLGLIGRAICERAKALGTTVIACNRTSRGASPCVDQLYSWDERRELIERCDFLVVCCALAPETSGVIGERELGAMRADAVLINVARAECVDEAALFAACENRTIAGATLDVWYAYPTAHEPSPAPSKYPFASLTNVVMTPHSAAWTTQMIDRRLAQIAGNMNRLALGRPLQNVVRPGR
ncbi:MAG: NAD(P)-dependent oxidoreductase [Minicystis sp.]